MKWRTVILYGVILCLLVGYFYYFEVIKEKEKKEMLKAKRRVFELLPENISRIEIKSENEKNIVIEKKEGKWTIVKPVRTPADQASVKGLLNVMKELETEKWIELPENADLKNYGLDSPHLKIRAIAGNKSYELAVGNQNPAETGYYAKASGKNKIFLVDPGRWEVLNKKLFDLREKELASFDNDKVRKLMILWNNGTTIEVVKKGNKWFAPSSEKLKIKKIKVENVLDQVRWLRARKFLKEGDSNLKEFGLDKPKIKIFIEMDDNTTVHEIALNNPPEKDKKANEFLVAYSRELPFVVYVDKDILDEIPKTLRDLEDRSLFVWQEDDIYELVWNENGKIYDFVKIDESKWGIKTSKGEKPRELKDSWRIRSLFWELEDIEYDRKLDKVPPLPDSPAYTITFKDDSGDELGKWIWQKLPEKEEENVTVWFSEKGKTEAVEVKASSMKGVIDKAQNIIETLNKKKEKQASD